MEKLVDVTVRSVVLRERLGDVTFENVNHAGMSGEDVGKTVEATGKPSNASEASGNERGSSVDVREELRDVRLAIVDGRGRIGDVGG